MSTSPLSSSSSSSSYSKSYSSSDACIKSSSDMAVDFFALESWWVLSSRMAVCSVHVVVGEMVRSDVVDGKMRGAWSLQLQVTVRLRECGIGGDAQCGERLIHWLPKSNLRGVAAAQYASSQDQCVFIEVSTRHLNFRQASRLAVATPSLSPQVTLPTGLEENNPTTNNTSSQNHQSFRPPSFNPTVSTTHHTHAKRRAATPSPRWVPAI